MKLKAYTMSVIISTIGMIMISIGLCEIGYGLNTMVWWLMIIGIATYSTGRGLR